MRKSIKAAPTAPPILAEGNVNLASTSIRMPPEMLRDLKIMAARRAVRVNDLLLDGIAHVLSQPVR